MTDTPFSSILEQIAELHHKHPDHTFAYIQEYIALLDDEDSPKAWVVKLYNQWQEMSVPRQQVCTQIFQTALQQAQQATYRPVNDLDAFLERQIYGIQDEKVVEKGLISAALEQQKQQRQHAQNKASESPMPHDAARRNLRPNRPGRTNPLNSVVLPPRSPEA